VRRAGHHGALRVRLIGRDVGRVRRVRFHLDRTRLTRVDRRRPFTVRVPARARPHHGKRKLRARIVLRGGRTVVRTKRIGRAPR
jgi:hypothetical protein